MKQLVLKTALAVGVMFAADQAVANETIYDCALKKGPRGSWVGERAVFWIDVDKGKAQVIDGVVDYVYGKPLPARLDVRNNGNLMVSWSVDEAPGRNVQTIVEYSAILIPKSGRVTINAVLPSYDNRSSGRGKCRIGTGG